MDPQTARTRLEDERRDARARLSAARATLERLRTERAEAGTADDEHDPDGSTLSAEWTMAAAQCRIVEEAIAEIGAGLARVDAGSYGICASCGRPIPRARLEARPAALTCANCANCAGSQ
ncbi:spore_yteA multi-domain protein [Acidipropionibacterium acidipropionici ATCC 4875]|uniref:Spore_yteA multi-domain protein n=1 Tax=Acidipropionibacterium acidipropionici (strain ATCC 4875 / DSM 20272 / JCM 6432 / NBRC 12425 / NCIMB 8070 / 4) TaxID=1171373 RepID=K7S4I7_ACIA4|nr:TraR/DksA C4-type zinc finger protein [Acidipropionibacterium acidipropionici]AFV89517.1 spore_yteA multi-domain protein [Acidipropionibacterium acidipropionici ATCC 4875]